MTVVPTAKKTDDLMAHQTVRLTDNQKALRWGYRSDSTMGRLSEAKTAHHWVPHWAAHSVDQTERRKVDMSADHSAYQWGDQKEYLSVD